MAVSMAVRSCLLVLAVLAVAPSAYGACNTTLLEAVQANPQLSQLAAVIQAANLSQTVNMTDNVTFLAPDNAAFNGSGGLIALLTANKLNLASVTAPGSNRAASILLYHIIPTPAVASQLTNGEQLQTALGNAYNLTVDKTVAATMTTVTFIGAGSNATVVSADNMVCNSVVHIVNAVLLPAKTFPAIPIYNGTAPAPLPGASGASSLSAGAWAFGLSAAVATAMLM